MIFWSSFLASFLPRTNVVRKRGLLDIFVMEVVRLNDYTLLSLLFLSLLSYFYHLGPSSPYNALLLAFHPVFSVLIHYNTLYGMASNQSKSSTKILSNCGAYLPSFQIFHLPTGQSDLDRRTKKIIFDLLLVL